MNGRGGFAPTRAARTLLTKIAAGPDGPVFPHDLSAG